MTEVTSVRDATKIMFQRYRDVLKNVSLQKSTTTDQFTSWENLEWMCDTGIAEIEHMPIDKLSRWLGFVQGVLVMNNILTVNEERDFSRPLFHSAYRNEGLTIPPSREMPKPE